MPCRVSSYVARVAVQCPTTMAFPPAPTARFPSWQRASPLSPASFFSSTPVWCACGSHQVAVRGIWVKARASGSFYSGAPCSPMVLRRTVADAPNASNSARRWHGHGAREGAGSCILRDPRPAPVTAVGARLRGKEAWACGGRETGREKADRRAPGVGGSGGERVKGARA
jgi:hypothetical protein